MGCLVTKYKVILKKISFRALKKKKKRRNKEGYGGIKMFSLMIIKVGDVV